MDVAANSSKDEEVEKDEGNNLSLISGAQDSLEHFLKAVDDLSNRVTTMIVMSRSCFILATHTPLSRPD